MSRGTECFPDVNFEETETLCREAGIKVIASGGVSKADDVRILWEKRACGIEGVILGKRSTTSKIDFGDLLIKCAPGCANRFEIRDSKFEIKDGLHPFANRKLALARLQILRLD